MISHCISSSRGGIPIGGDTRNWHYSQLDALCTKITDGSHYSPKECGNGEYKIATVADIGHGGFNLSSCKSISKKDYEQLVRNGCKPEIGAVLFSKDGTIGTSFVFKQESNLVLLSSIAIIAANKDILDSDYCSFVLQAPAILSKIQSRRTGSAIKRIILKDLKKVRVPCPPLPEQRKIAAILSTVDAAIERTDAIIARLKDVKASLFHDLITRGIDKMGLLRDPLSHPDQFKNVPFLGLIPVEWNSPSIGSLAVHVGSGITPKGGSKVYRNDGVVFIRSQNVIFDGLIIDKISHIDFETHMGMKRSEVFAHDVLLNITGASIGRCCPLPENVSPANVNQHVCAIRLPDPSREDAILLSSILASNIGQSQIDRFNAGGNREGLNYEQLRSFIIPWPCQEERRRIASVIDVQDSRLRNEEDYLLNLKKLRLGLMQDLLTGRVRVKVDDHA